MMARAASCQPAVPLARSSNCAARTGTSRGSPMTPVEAISTCPESQPRRDAMPRQLSSTASMPPDPVKAFALPALTRMARASAGLAASASRHQITGAAAVSDRVKTPAIAAPSPTRISSMSSRPEYFRPDAAVDRVNPAIGGIAGKDSGASGETVIAWRRPLIAPRSAHHHRAALRHWRPSEASRQRVQSSAATCCWQAGLAFHQALGPG